MLSDMGINRQQILYKASIPVKEHKLKGGEMSVTFASMSMQTNTPSMFPRE